ncbi:prolipoprotein diacylglyceryl transferase [Tepidamorphus sp. 3E244]|uniref:prolipoprotein diacylglyceryl transferase n=1 Tax=Tepidamorphus sp. 3E244 TaxID=3385498 RepID=UPI0038FC62CA
MSLFAIPFPAIDPIAIEIGPFAVRWYALAYIGGILAGWWYALRLVSNQRLWGPAGSPLTPKHVDDFLLFATVGLILGGRLGFVFFYQPDHYLANPGDILKVWEGGMAFHGGFIGFLLAVGLFSWWRNISPFSLGDICGAVVPIGLFFGRLANFANGELWGRVSDVPWAMVFPGAGDEPRHPSQLYQACLEGVLLFIALRIVTHHLLGLRRPGVASGVFIAGYGLARIIGEQFRQPDAYIGFLWGGLTMGILLSVPMVMLGVGIAVWAWNRPPRTVAE